MTFKSEISLMQSFMECEAWIDIINSEEYITHYEEMKGLFGIPDLLIVTNSANGIRLMACELKLRDWKRGLIQAFKYRAFSNLSYLVIDESYIHLITRNLEMFIKANIGIISISDQGDVITYYTPIETEPYSKELYFKVLESLETV
jgi:hypothetical protein